MDRENTATESRAGTWLKIALIGAAIVGVALLGRSAGDRVQEFAAWVEGLGPLGPAVFVAGYAVAVVAFVPASLLTLAAGAIFGVAAGTGYVFVAATLGACGGFLVARYLARSAVERRIANDERFSAIDRAVGREGRKIVFLLRLSPIFPFNLLNYALGLTRVRFSDYAVACIGMLPGTLLYVYLGSAAGSLAAIASGQSATGDTGGRAILFGGLAITAIVTVLVTRVARRALQQATSEGSTSEVRG